MGWDWGLGFGLRLGGIELVTKLGERGIDEEERFKIEEKRRGEGTLLCTDYAVCVAHHFFRFVRSFVRSFVRETDSRQAEREGAKTAEEI